VRRSKEESPTGLRLLFVSPEKLGHLFPVTLTSLLAALDHCNFLTLNTLADSPPVRPSPKMTDSLSYTAEWGVVCTLYEKYKSRYRVGKDGFKDEERNLLDTSTPLCMRIDTLCELVRHHDRSPMSQASDKFTSEVIILIRILGMAIGCYRYSQASPGRNKQA
jgi:hypothetical protein